MSDDARSPHGQERVGSWGRRLRQAARSRRVSRVAQPGVPGPQLVALVDLDRPVALHATRPSGSDYAGAWVVGTRGGRPFSLLEIDFAGPQIGAEDLVSRLAAHLPNSAELSRPPGAGAGRRGRLPPAVVVVPTRWRREASLERCIGALLQMDYPDFEVVIVDNRSPHAPRPLPPWALKTPGVRVLHESTPGVSAARNRALMETTREIIAFTDDDIEVDRHWLGRLVAPFVDDSSVACVTGIVFPRELDTPAQLWFEEYFGGFRRDFRPKIYRPVPVTGAAHRLWTPGSREVRCATLDGTDEVPLSLYSAAARCGGGGNCAFRVPVLRACGGFDETLGTGTPAAGGEDLAAFVRLLQHGHAIVYEPAAMVFHGNRETVGELEAQVQSYGRGLGAMCTALVFEDPRHALMMAGLLKAALASLLQRESSAMVVRDANRSSYPRTLRRRELLGLATGPVAFLRSRLAAARQSA